MRSRAEIFFDSEYSHSADLLIKNTHPVPLVSVGGPYTLGPELIQLKGVCIFIPGTEVAILVKIWDT